MTMMRNSESDDNNDDHKNHNDCDDHDYVDHNKVQSVSGEVGHSTILLAHYIFGF